MALDCGSNITGPASNTIQGFFIMNIITFTFLLLCLVTLQVQLVDKLCKLHILKLFTSGFTMIHRVWELIIGLYRVAHLCRQLYAPVQKATRNNPELNHRLTQTAPPMDEYTTGLQIRPTLLLDDYSPLLAPLTTEESTLKAVFQPPKLPKPTEDKASDSETPVSQVTPLLGLHPEKNVNSNTTHRMTFGHPRNTRLPRVCRNTYTNSRWYRGQSTQKISTISRGS